MSGMGVRPGCMHCAPTCRAGSLLAPPEREGSVVACAISVMSAPLAACCSLSVGLLPLREYVSSGVVLGGVGSRSPAGCMQHAG